MSPSAASSNSVSSLFYSPPLTIVLSVILLICFFIFFSMYFCKCVLKNFLSSIEIHRSPGAMLANSGALVSAGLDPAIVQSFPSFKYSTVKDFRKEKYGLECSICLAEFGDEDFLRLLTVCYHVFHQECIDLWLGSHKTCPVCRRDLDFAEKSLDKSPILIRRTNSTVEFEDSNDVLHDSVSIEINDDSEFHDCEVECASQEQKGTHNKRDRSSRPHSTGHSITISDVEEDRYTLRLLENVKLKITKGHNSTASCITFGEFSSPIGTRNRGDDGAECSRGNINRV